MHRMPHAIALAALVLAGCSDDAPETTPPAELASCTLVGCDDVVLVRFRDLLALHANALPLTAEVSMDGQTTTAEIALGAPGAEGCVHSEEGTACCVLDPSGSEFDCWPEVNGDLRLMLHVTQGVFDEALHDVSATVRGNDGAVLLDAQSTAELHMHQPNGPMCEPTCFQGGVQFPDVQP